jgi:glycosyltransferase involved in cell wall biosynthesis
MRFLLIATISETLRGFFLPFARHFRKLGWTVGAAAWGAPDCPDCRDGFDDVWHVEWSRDPLDPRNLLRAPRRLRQIVAAGRYDVVHVNTPVAAFITRLALRRRDPDRGPALIYTAHGFHFHENAPAWRNAAFAGLERLAAPWTDYLVVMNQFDREMAQRYRLAAPDRLLSIPGIGVDRSFYSRESVSPGAGRDVRRELGLGGAPVFLMIGEFIPRKRHADAIAALARLRDSSAHLVMAGEGPLLEPMKELAARLGVSGRTHFAGVRKDIPALLSVAQAVLLPSEHEGLPRAILEAMSMGVAAIGAEIRGTRELLGAGAGHLVPSGDVERLAAAMRRVLDAPGETRAMGEEGRRQSAAYDLRLVLRRYEDLYLRAAKRQPLDDVICMPVR